MESKEQQIRTALEELADGATCDYNFVEGVVAIVKVRESRHEWLDLDTFRALFDQGLISKQGRVDHCHLVFHPTFRKPIDIYHITEKGRKYLKGN
jgi:hypothetical protein